MIPRLFPARLLMLLGCIVLFAACDGLNPAPTPPPGLTPASTITVTAPGSPTAALPTLPAPPPAPATQVAPAGTPVPRGGTLTLRLEADVTTLNPFFTARSLGEVDRAAEAVTGLIFNGLTRLDNRLQPVPDLAESWTVAPDGLSLDFKLRPGLVWADGAPLTVDDVTWTYQSYLKLPVATTAQVHLQDAVLAIRAAPDLTDTVQFLLKKKYAPILTDLAAPILPKHLLGDVPLERLAVDPFSYKPVGSGPFQFVERKEGQSIVLAANPRYWGGRPALDGVAFLIAPDAGRVATALADGSLLAAEVPQDVWQATTTQTGATSRYTLGSYAAPGYYFIGFNLRPGHLFSDTVFRRAFALALDKAALVQAATGGSGVAVWSDVPPASWANAPDTPRQDRNPDQARGLLDDAGWRPGPNGTRRKDDKALAFQLLVPADDPVRRDAAARMVPLLANVGISMTVAPVDFASVMRARLDPRREPPFEFDAMFLGWDSSATDPDNFALFHSSQIPTKDNPGGYNFPAFAAPEFDARCIEARGEYDFSKRAALQARMQQILAEELPYYFGWSEQRFLILNRRIGGPIDPTSPRWLWNIEKWWFAP